MVFACANATKYGNRRGACRQDTLLIVGGDQHVEPIPIGPPGLSSSWRPPADRGLLTTSLQPGRPCATLSMVKESCGVGYYDFAAHIYVLGERWASVAELIGDLAG